MTAIAPIEYWTSVASSSDGSKLAATASPGGIYTWQSSPVLSILPSGGILLITWQASSSAAGCVLQENSDLSTTSWVAVTNLPVMTNGLEQVTIPLFLSGDRFYRLMGP